MRLEANLLIIFGIILLLLLFTALFPSWEVILMIMLMSTALIIFQVVLILKDKQ